MCPNSPSTAQAAKHWYEIVSGPSFRQGDIIGGLPVFFLDESEELPTVVDEDDVRKIPVNGKYILGNWIVVTPSCDLDTGRAKHVLLAYCAEATDRNLKAQGQKDRDQKLQVMSQGLDPSHMLLPESADEPAFPLSFADIRSLGSLPIVVVRRFVGSKRRLRLKHPFREKLGNWCGQWISNVGPENEMLMPRFAQVHSDHILKQNEG